MTIDEAIEILKKRKLAYQKTNFPDRVAAIQLSIEALRRLALYRKGMYIGLGDKLPGETKD